MKGYWKSLVEKYNNLVENVPAQIIIHNPQNITINNSPEQTSGDISSNPPIDNSLSSNSSETYNDEELLPAGNPNEPHKPITTDELKAAAQNYVPGMEDPNANPNNQQITPEQQSNEMYQDESVPVDPNSNMQIATYDTLSQFQAPDGTPFANPDGSPLDFEKQKYEDEDYPNEDDLPSPERPDGNAPHSPDNQVSNTLPYEDEEPQTTESVTDNSIQPQMVMDPSQMQQMPVDPNTMLQGQPQPYNDENIQDPNQQVPALPGDPNFGQNGALQPNIPVDQQNQTMDMGMQPGAIFDPTQIQQQNSGMSGQINDPIAPDYYDDEEGQSMIPDPNNPGEMIPSDDMLPQSNSQTPIPRDGIRKMNELKDIYTNLIEVKKILKNETHPMLDKLRKKHTESLEYFESMIENLDSFTDVIDDMIIKYKRFLLLLLVELATFKKKIAEFEDNK